jgi:hypothetical protein
MTLAEREATRTKRELKILVYDIERIKGEAAVEFWSLSDFKNRRIHADDVTAWPRTICVAWKFLGDKRTQFASEWADGHDGMHRKIWDAFNAADITVGHNSKAFDEKHLNTGWRDLGMTPPAPSKAIDTLSVARSRFGDESKTLDALCHRLGLAGKSDRYSLEMAKAACSGDKTAQRKLKAYNVGDIAASEALVDRLRGWIPSHPHNLMGTADDRPTCNQCWGDNLVRNGTKLAQQISYTLYRCADCGANVQGTRHSRAAITRGAR